MLEIKLQPICYECKDIEINVDTERLYSGGEVIETDCTITCAHDGICKKIKLERVFSIAWINYLFPCCTSRRLSDWGVLNKHKNETYTLQEINKIISDLFLKEPYIQGACNIEISFMWQEKNMSGIHHVISFENYRYKEEKPKKSAQLQYRG